MHNDHHARFRIFMPVIVVDVCLLLEANVTKACDYDALLKVMMLAFTSFLYLNFTFTFLRSLEVGLPI